MFGRALTALSVCAATLAGAGEYVNNPGLCEAADGEQELAGIVWFSDTGIDAHWEGCTFDTTLPKLRPGKTIQMGAQCGDGAGQWRVTFELTLNSQNRITAFADGPTSLPEFYFDCAKWGYKGGQVSSRQ